MARIPRSARQVLPSGQVAGAPVPFDIADTGQGLEARALGQVGQAITGIGETLFTIEREKQVARDDAAVANAVAGENRLVFDEVSRINRTVFGSVDDIKRERERLSTVISDNRDLVTQGMSDDAKQRFANRSVLSESARLGQFENALFRKEIDLGKSQASLNLGQNYEAFFSDATSVSQKEDALESIEETKKGFARYFDAGELESLEERTKISALKNLGKYEQAKDVAMKTKAFTPQDREAVLASIERAQKAGKTRNQELFDTAASKVEPNWLQRYRDGDPTLEDDIERWTYGGNDPEMIRKQVDLKEEWFKKLDSLPVKDRTSNIYAAWAAKVDLDPTAQVDGKSLREAIYAQVGPNREVNLSIKEAEALVTKLEGNLSGQNTADKANHSKFQGLLTAQWKAGLFGKPDKNKTKETYNKLALQLTEFSINNPQASGREWQDTFDAIRDDNAEPFPFSRLLSGVFEAAEIVVPGVTITRGVFDKLTQARNDTLAAIPTQAPKITSFKVGDTQAAPDGTQYIMIKKGNTPAEDEWLPIQ
jgi:hypothetical protein